MCKAEVFGMIVVPESYRVQTPHPQQELPVTFTDSISVCYVEKATPSHGFGVFSYMIYTVVYKQYHILVKMKQKCNPFSVRFSRFRNSQVHTFLPN